MRNAILRFILSLIVQAMGGLAFAQEASGPDLKVLKVESAGSGLELTSAVRSLPTDNWSLRIKDSAGKTQSVSAKSIPMNLWILVDTSSLCSPFKMDKYLSGVFAKLPKVLHAETLVTVMSYTQDSKTTLLNNTSVATQGGLEDLRIQCQPEALSASFEGALTQLISQSQKNNLPTEVWVYSSGNVVMSPSIVKEFEQRDISLSLSLYVPVVFTEIQPLLASNSKALGEKFSYSVLKQDPRLGPVFPELRVSSQFNPSLAAQGSTSAFKLEVVRNNETLAATSFQALVPRSWYSIFLGPEFKIFLLFVLLYGLYRLVKSYFPKTCRTCQRTLKFGQKHCAFCHGARSPSLVVSDVGATDSKTFDTLTLPEGSATLYKSRYGLSTKGSKSQALIKIEKRVHGGQEAFALLPHNNNIEDHFGKNARVLLNAKELSTPRFLANGDRIQIGNQSVSFLVAEKKSEENTHEKAK